MGEKSLDESTQKDKPLFPKDRKRHPLMLRILRWLQEDDTRTLPLPDDDEGIQELAQAIDKSTEYTRTLMAQMYGDQSADDTLRI